MPANPPHVVIIDDDPAVRRLIELTLRKGGFRFSMAANGLRALEHIQTEPPDLIICDLMMPDMDGFQFLSAIKSIPMLASIPVIVVTAAGQQLYVEKALRLGAAACLFKPFSQVEFFATVQKALGLTS